jgi:hypothetical protein
MGLIHVTITKEPTMRSARLHIIPLYEGRDVLRFFVTAILGRDKQTNDVQSVTMFFAIGVWRWDIGLFCQSFSV